MKIQILPNWFKKVGLILFIVGSIIGGGDDFVVGFMGPPYNSEPGKISMLVGEKLIHTFYVLSFIGMLIYMLSKEKMEDDYINKLRLESFQLTSIATLIIAIFMFAISKKSNFPLDYFITLFFWFYLITFYIKKRIDL